ncbi:MAG TPA: hypothetical protein VF791_01825 [Pyrinomonadaceae bacterium]
MAIAVSFSPQTMTSESFESFGKTLMPVLQELGINPGQPAIGEIHNIIKG